LVVILFEASSAVTVKLKAVPAVAEAGAVTEKWVARGVEPPHALRTHKLEIEIRTNRDFFIAPPEERRRLYRRPWAGLSRSNQTGITNGERGHSTPF
jgi:hypothetical protein